MREPIHRSRPGWSGSGQNQQPGPRKSPSPCRRNVSSSWNHRISVTDIRSFRCLRHQIWPHAVTPASSRKCPIEWVRTVPHDGQPNDVLSTDGIEYRIRVILRGRSAIDQNRRHLDQSRQCRTLVQLKRGSDISLNSSSGSAIHLS